MKKFIIFIIDIIFPPTKEEVLLRSFSPEEFYRKIRPAPASPLSFIACIFAYKDPIATELIWQIKSKKNAHAVSIGAFALYSRLREMGISYAVLIPIPISKERRRERGYNQCELLVNEIMQIDAEKFEKRFDILIRTKHTKEKQAFKNREERLQGVGNIFAAKSFPELFNSPIIIIDDVVTTGSTTKEAHRTLLLAGYTNVRILALAH